MDRHSESEDLSDNQGGERNEDGVQQLSDALESLNINPANTLLCTICQDSIVHPVTLPCNHTFCYLCLKGVYARSRSCALCRQHIPEDVITKPISLTSNSETGSPGVVVQWLYEAKDGRWWLYEQRLIDEIERAFNAKKTMLELQISGFMYVIDFEAMVQYRAEKPNRRRNIKRQMGMDNNDQLDCKGVAGILLKRADNSDNSHPPNSA